MTALMRLSGVGLRRAGRTLFSGLSFDVAQGTVTVVLGPNGAGKSSLLLCLAGMLDCEGRIDIMGRDIRRHRRAELACRLAWSGALPATDFGLTVAQRLELAAAGRPIEAAARAMEIMALLDRPLGWLSSGELQRAELAAMMLRDVPLWLVDEPTAHLDLKHQVAVLSMLKTAAEAGRGIIVVLHDIQQARRLADCVVLFDGKGGVVHGSADALLTPKRLSAVFDTAIVPRDDVWLPDYVGGCEGG